jgi:hypothetical protein
VRSTIAVCQSSTLVKRWARITFLLLGMGSARAFAAPTADDPSPPRYNISLPRLDLITVAPRPATLRTRWERFDAEFGLHDQSSSLVAGSLLRVKYAVDVACFGVRALSTTIGDATELRYSHGRIRRASTALSDPSPRSAHHAGPIVLEDARLKFDFEMASSKPYVGVRLVLPFGD